MQESKHHPNAQRARCKADAPKRVALTDSDAEMELPDLNGRIVSLHEPKISERKKWTVEADSVKEQVSEPEDIKVPEAKAEVTEKKVTEKQEAKKEVTKQAEQSEPVKVNLQPKKDTPKVILHGSRLITNTPSLPKAPVPIRVDRVQQVALQDAGTRSRRSLKNDIIRPAKPQKKVNVRQADNEQPSVNRFYTRGQQIDMARIHQQVRNMSEQPQPVQYRPSGKELKEQAIRQAIADAERQIKPSPKQREKRVRFGAWRVLLALSCAAAAAFGIVYLVDINSTSAPMKVAAMQSGIDASYPSYVPRDFDLSDITSENGKITLNFKNSNTGDAFTLIEEQLTGNFEAALHKYVSDTYGSDATLVQESGVTNFYHSGSNAAWVSDSILYKLIMTKGSFTKKQITNIVKSV